MIFILALAWLLLSIGIYLFLIGTAYYAYVHDAHTIELVAKFTATIAAHTAIVIPGGFMAGMYMFAQAHSPSPLTVDSKELVVAFLFLEFEALVGWLLCSAMVGRLIGTSESID